MVVDKLKPIAVEEYSKAFTKKLCAAFFQDQEIIVGKQIVSFTAIYQVNLFILYKLFDRWQQETAKLRSPYFDYSHPEVQQALSLYMNTLSRHIAIRQEEFEPLVIRSVSDTLKLVLTPHDFFRGQLTHNPVVKVSRLREMLKYLHINKALLKQLTDSLESAFGEEIEWAKAVTLWDELYQHLRLTVEPSEPVIDLFNKKVLLHVDDLRENPRVQFPMPTFTPTDSLFDSELLDRLTNASQPGFPSTTELGIGINKDDAFNSSQTTHTLHNDASEDVSLPLHEKFGSRQPILNEKFEENVSENFLNKQLKINSIHNAISLNQKFIFVGDLFGGDVTQFQSWVEVLDRASSKEEALQFIHENIASKYGWDFGTEAVQEFMEIVERRFI
jgi:hypothetical protein